MTLEHTSDGYVKTYLESTTPEDYKNNLWYAVQDFWTAMYAETNMKVPAINSIILRDVRIYIKEMETYARKDLHGMSAHKRRKLR